jgi:hypothetical protein
MNPTNGALYSQTRSRGETETIEREQNYRSISELWTERHWGDANQLGVEEDRAEHTSY